MMLKQDPFVKSLIISFFPNVFLTPGLTQWEDIYRVAPSIKVLLLEMI